jgi:hypothetical protein
MADELHDIEPDLLRERLLALAEHGEITGKQAEEIAAAHGLEPFATKPELPRFDPKLKSHWSILMVVAWIAWRDFDLVREQDPEFCSECFHWVDHVREVHLQPGGEPVERTVYSLETRSPPTVSRLTLQAEFLRDSAKGSVSAVMRIPEAVAALWQALSQGDLVAVGFDAQGTVGEVPSREWPYLRLREEEDRGVLSYDAVSKPEPFTAVKLRQSDVLRLWPAKGEVPVLPAAVPGKAQRDWQIDRIKRALGIKFPDGVPPEVTLKEVQRSIVGIFRKNCWKPPSLDSIARALGRRKVVIRNNANTQTRK